MADSCYLIEEVAGNKTLIDLAWNDIKCSVKTKQGTKQILKGVTGHALHGEFLVIMGSSGAGKTTLLNILSNRLQNSKKVAITGEVLANSSPISDIFYTNYIGYVTQEDTLIETMTVYECLMFVARLKTTYINKKAKVLELINLLKLDNCKNSYIGGPYMKGISGGEKKRTSIGIELITNPSVLFLDEPTSGLDSYTAMIVCKLLLSEANSGKTIISTIHQPGSEIFHLFDKLMLMCDGQIVYHGLAKNSLNFFAQCGLACPEHSNPADYFMEVLYLANSNELSKEELKRVEMLAEANKKIQKNEPMLTVPLNIDEKVYKSGFFTQLYYLLGRSVMRMIRNPILSVVRIALLAVIALMVLFFYYNMGQTGIQDMMNRNGLIFFNVACLVFCNILACVLTFPTMRPIMIKEYQSNTYGVVPYFLAQCITDVFADLIQTLSYVSIIYWAVNFNTTSFKVVVEYYIMVYLEFYIGGSLGMLTGCVFDKPELALASTSGLLFPFMYFAGFYRSGNLPKAFKWMEYTSPFFYVFQGCMKNQYEDFKITDCYVNPIGQKLDCDPLDNFDIHLSVHFNMMILALLIVFYRTLAFIAMKVMCKHLKNG
ncbi:hypothetical protein SteCoe_3059 [Stentor coeruleus]|uniref:ABC transporter domain-containing protein n=1 Tax=Stentor coeruleus TaxID=5963 RepID=A0A1R2CY10_9CILI|nr:hypothetical protein SteCoe_3059 [Stentor coeruleus]